MALVSALEMPRYLQESVRDDDDPARRDWYAQLPELIPMLAERWSLQLDRPFQPGGQVSWVAPARDASGRDVVLKVGWGHKDAAYEALGLRTWDGAGAVLIYDEYAFDSTCALLLERC